MRHHEFWPPRLFEAPYYIYLLLQCAWFGLAPKSLAKANFCLDHGELGLGSKFATQMAFRQDKFLPTILLSVQASEAQRREQFTQFANVHSYPLILKPDIGAVGKGIVKINDERSGLALIRHMKTDYLLQKFTPFTVEFGVFFVRLNGECFITGMNQKHFPTVTGDGIHTIEELARQHERFTDHWPIFLRYLDTQRIPAEGETLQLSFIGSHTMGCKFTDDSDQVTDALRQSIFDVCADVPGFNFGRFDVKAANVDALLNGEFLIIEVNGIASLPTHMFDPAGSLIDAYRIFLRHGKLLARAASEHSHREMPLDSYRDIWRRAKTNAGLLNEVHAQARDAKGG